MGSGLRMPDIPAVESRAVGRCKLGVLNEDRGLIPFTRGMPGGLEEGVALQASRGRPWSHPGAACLVHKNDTEQYQAEVAMTGLHIGCLGDWQVANLPHDGVADDSKLGGLGQLILPLARRQKMTKPQNASANLDM